MGVNIIIFFYWKISFVWLVMWLLPASEKCSQTDGIHLNKKGKRSADSGAMAPDITIWKYCLDHMSNSHWVCCDGPYYNNLLLHISHWPCVEFLKLSYFYQITLLVLIGINIVTTSLHVMLLLRNFKSPYRC